MQSAEQFAGLLRAEGVEPDMKQGKNELIYAFAKTDQFMRDLLEDENDRVRTLAEARLGVKSTLMQTRAETLGWMATRGPRRSPSPVPVYLRYAGTGTLRMSGGDGANWPNFKRNSDLRRALMAPDGYLLGPVDASQIECRRLHYLAGGVNEPVIQKLMNKEDPYVDLATRFYCEPIYKPAKDDPRKAEMEAKRGMGKQGRLMCFAAIRGILTNNGIKPIIEVTLADLVWDGLEWVTHGGVLLQGAQNVVDIKGVRVTPDHPILCGRNRWLPAALLQKENILSLALDSGSENLKLLATSWLKKAGLSLLSLDVRAAILNIRLIHTIFLRAEARAVSRALKKQAAIGLKNPRLCRCLP